MIKTAQISLFMATQYTTKSAYRQYESDTQFKEEIDYFCGIFNSGVHEFAHGSFRLFWLHFIQSLFSFE